MENARSFKIGWRAGAAFIVALVVGLIATAQASAEDLDIGHITLLRGENAQFGLEATDLRSPGLAAWTVDIDYNDDVVTPISCVSGPGSFCNLNYGDSTIRVIGASATGIRPTATLATLRFRCDSEGASALALTAVEFADATVGSPQPIAVDVEHGSINCLDTDPQGELRGDANCDGVVNSIDAAIVLQFVARLRSSVPCPDNADVDLNGRITAVDAALILQIHAGLLRL